LRIQYLLTRSETARVVRFVVKLLASQTQRKHVIKWLISLRNEYLLNTPSPWMTFDAIDFLSTWLPAKARVFEYGSGGSTLFWLQRGVSCISVEHDQTWYTIVKDRIHRQHYTGAIDYRWVPPESMRNHPADPANPADYASADARYQAHTFYNYVTQIDAFSDGYFDIVLVDGRARPSCIAHAVSKVKPGGLLIVDNADRAYYFTQTGSHLEGMDRKPFYGAGPINWIMWQTDFFGKEFK
jgi:hypothetical protein